MLVAISLAFPFLFGLGCFMFFCCRSLRAQYFPLNESKRLQAVANIFVFGILLNYDVVLALSGLKQSLLLASVLSIIGLGYFVRVRMEGLPPLLTPAWGALFFVLSAASLLTILIEPVDGWDARSIWFFHAKMIYYNGSVHAGGDWSLPSIAFSHPDYPELMPILSAQVAFVAGYWNEYLPKLSLAILLMPALLLMISILQGRWWRTVFIAVPLLFTWPWLKNGYMDGYLALYSGLATFYWGRWLDGRDGHDMVSAILLMGVAVGLKNEALLYCLAVLVLLPVFLFKSMKVSGRPSFIIHKSTLLVALVSGAGYVLWERMKMYHNLQNDLHIGFGSMGRIAERLNGGALGVILKHLYVIDNVNLTFGAVLLSLALAAFNRRLPGAGAWFCTSVGILYFIGIVTVYLATPYDLVSFHLPTGNRTMLPVHLMLLVATLSIWDADRSEPTCLQQA